ncbi:mediator of RNA polymerase II transcription subunit 13 isoform X1 [Selaginella moellendorffii]|uniref:mediator of RNA polymerase II transcription subunit 13 isoform X1 n=1 Tax=Selaginella moellendorffii TaxID=88036 RepID=UPI000D1C655F|nr:mediator of RNA polymerase II transcription subunit 13 isoform X1 [Selaginella moellendorffii]|eukprot:XP_024521898.1 mediator of RNA polymerase II transcription subunit 13 isoform X1 [Selaginella moellendorffii]
MMFTNVFRIGGLQEVSWFQLVADDSQRKNQECSEDKLAKQLLAAHIELQNEGRLSSWTYSSQDKGQKLKLWLFLPGRHIDSRPSLDLKVLKSGVWTCPGTSTEVTAALCQALRNRFERALGAFAYVRFGDMFVKCKRYTADDSDFRRTLPSCEATFFASEEGVFLHLRISRRRMRPLAASDVRAVLTQHLTSSTPSIENPAVVVAPYGLTGWLTGCCPGDLVRQISQSKSGPLKDSSIKSSVTPRNGGFASRSWYVEVRMRFQLAKGKSQPKTDQNQWIEKVFIFPPEAVVVPTVPPISARTYLKRCWLRKQAGTHWLEDAFSVRKFLPLTNLAGHRLQAMGKANTIWKLNSNGSKSSTSSGSGGSSIKSSDSRGSSGSESDVNDDGDYREDADSAATLAGPNGTMISSSGRTPDGDNKRLPGSKRGREHGNDMHNSSKSARRTSPEISSSAANNAESTKGAPSQAGTPWDWTDQVNIQSDADFFAEFGDFGDFFEGDGLGFGEPPGTMESQSYMFPFDGDGSNTPGTQFIETSDPMRLPILDFPMLEVLGQAEDLEKEQDTGTVVDEKCEPESSPPVLVPAGLSLVAKSEAALIFASEYAPIDITGLDKLDRKPAYKPDARKETSASQSASYVYGATPPPTPKLDSYERKAHSRWRTEFEERKNVAVNNFGNLKYGETSPTDNTLVAKTGNSHRIQGPLAATLATELECAMFQLQLHSVKGFAYCAHPNEHAKLTESSHKECTSEITDSSDACDSLRRKPDRKKVPERIAGDTDDLSHDGPRPVEVGVWRPVGLPKPQQRPPDGGRGAVSNIASPEVGTPSEISDAAMQDIVDLIPLLVQQAACCNDISLNGEHGDGALAWLTLQQKLSQQDLSWTSDVCDPSITEISPATVASILQSDMRQAVGVAFSDINAAGPLSLAEWCRGKTPTDNHSGPSDSKDLVSSITGEPITPPQSAKVVSLQDLDNHAPEFRRSGREAEDAAQRRLCVDDAESQALSYAMLPVPTLLVGYQEDWLRTAPRSLRYWEKAPFEPYGYPKSVTYYVICAGLDPLLCSALEFFQQLSSVYEACKLGAHIPANVTAQTVSKRLLPGFVPVDFPSKLKGSSSSINLANDYITAMDNGWDVSEFRKSLRKACKSLNLGNSVSLEADHENSPSTVLYVVSPSSEPSMVLQTLMETCQSIGPNLNIKKASGKNSMEDGKQPVAGFSIGRLALQVVTPETVIRLSSSPAAGLDILKELSFAVYNKLRRIPYKAAEDTQQYGFASKSRMGLQSNTAMTWKDCRNVSLLDTGNLRWDKSWSSSRLLETSASGPPAPFRLLYEPLFILADGCILDHSMGQLTKARTEEVSTQSFGIPDTGSVADGVSRTSSQPLSFHCCYSWTSNWLWLIAVWIDSQGKMLDVNVFPSPRCTQDKDDCSKELCQLFSQVMQQGQQLLATMSRTAGNRGHTVTVTRMGDLYETEYQEWQRVFMNIAGDESRVWPVVIRPDSGGDASSLSQQRNVSAVVGFPSSPGSSSSFVSRGLLPKPEINFHAGKLAGVTLATVSGDESLQVLSLAESAAASTWSVASSSGLASGFGMAKTIASLNGAYLFIPAHGLRSLSSSDSVASNKVNVPAFGQWIQSRGSVSPVASGYVISGPTTALRAEVAQVSMEEEWPSTLQIGLVAHFGSSKARQETQGMRLGGNGLCDNAGSSSNTSGSSASTGKQGSSSGIKQQIRYVLEQLGAEFYGLSWLTISPMYLHRRRPLPYHCDVAQRLEKLLGYMEAAAELSPTATTATAAATAS